MEEAIKKYNQFGKDQAKPELFHMNCAEVLLRSANDSYDLNLGEEVYHLMQGFGGGFYAERTCGAFTGALAGLGAIYSKSRPTRQADIKAAAQLLVEEFESEFGSLDCDYIKEHFRDRQSGCGPVKLRAGQVMKRVIKQMEEAANE